MRVRLERCKHLKVHTYRADSDVARGLCESCFGRVYRSMTARPAVRVTWVDDQPIAGVCNHARKNEIASPLTVNKPYRNAMCMTCGAGLRAPNNLDEWTPLREYRYIIKEWA